MLVNAWIVASNSANDQRQPWDVNSAPPVYLARVVAMVSGYVELMVDLWLIDASLMANSLWIHGWCKLVTRLYWSKMVNRVLIVVHKLVNFGQCWSTTVGSCYINDSMAQTSVQNGWYARKNRELRVPRLAYVGTAVANGSAGSWR